MSLDLNEDEEKDNKKKKAQTEEEAPEKEEQYTHDEFLAWMGKGTGKGGKPSSPKGGKRGFQGNCHYCGTYGHRINECRKKDADMKRKGTGMGAPQGPGWGNPNPGKGKSKGNNGFWDPGKGAWGRG